MSICLKSITKKYGSRAVLSNVNLEFPNKGMVFIVGDNGSGKTTLLNIIGLIDETIQGEVVFNGSSINYKDKKNLALLRATHINYIFQESNLIEDLTVSQNINIYKNIKGIKDNGNHLFTDEIEQLKNKYPKTLSGGERQKTAIIRGLLSGDILLCDEPVASLDYQSSIEVMEKLQKISKDKLVIVVMHDRTLTKRYADRVIELKDGIVVKNEEINLRDKVEIISSPKRVSFKSTILPLVFSFFKFRKFKSFMYAFLLTLFSLLFVLLISLVSFDAAKEISQRLENDEKIMVSKRITTIDPLTGKNLEHVVLLGDSLHTDVLNKFADSEYDYVINSDYGPVYFGSNSTLKNNEVLVDIDTYYAITDSYDFELGKTLQITKSDLGISLLELDIIGISSKEGIYASKETLNRNELTTNKVSVKGGMFLNENIESLTQHYYTTPIYVRLSYCKNLLLELGYDEEQVSEVTLNADEIIISRGYYDSYVDNKDDNNTVLQFLEIPDSVDPYFKDSFIHLKEMIFQNGAILKGVFPSSLITEDEYLSEYIVVDDQVFDHILAYVPLYDSLYMNVNENNKYRISEFFLEEKLRFDDSTLEYISQVPIFFIQKAYIVIIPLIIVFIVSLLIIFSLFTSVVLLAKKNEIGLLQSFGFTKIKSIIPSILVIIFTGLLSIMFSVILSPSVFKAANSVFYNMNKFDVALFNFKPTIVLYLIITLIVLFVINIGINYNKIRKLNPKDILKFN